MFRNHKLPTTTTSLSFMLKRGQCLHLVDFSVNYCAHVDCGGCVRSHGYCWLLSLAQELCKALAKAPVVSVACFDQRRFLCPRPQLYLLWYNVGSCCEVWEDWVLEEVAEHLGVCVGGCSFVSVVLGMDPSLHGPWQWCTFPLPITLKCLLITVDLEVPALEYG